jgi:hypothetical protein
MELSLRNAIQLDVARIFRMSLGSMDYDYDVRIALGQNRCK